MKFLLKLLFIPYLALLFLAACGDSEKEVANGYTEEQNASLDSAAYAMLQTWEPKVALRLAMVEDKNLGLSWYDVEFTTDATPYYEHAAETVDEACTVDLYVEQNGVRMNLTRTYKKNSYTEFLSRDSLDAVVEDHLDNSYNGDSAVANCRTDSTVFADYCAENGGDVTDYFMLEKCSVLHLSCVMKFTPKVAAGEYLQATAKRMKDRCIAEFYAPEEDPAEVDSTLPVDSTLLVDSRDGQTYRTVRIGDQVWMAENLNYQGDFKSYCYENDDENCEKYGRMYSPDDAKTACPEGWRLPSAQDFVDLENNTGKDMSALRATDGWESGNGSDLYGFSLYPAGRYSIIGNTLKFVQMGVAAYLWTDTESEFGILVFDGLNIGYPATSMTSDNYLNVRCVKE